MTVLVLVVLTVAAAIAVIAGFVFGNDPFRGNTTTQDARDSENDRYYASADRPAGPDAESDPLPEDALGTTPLADDVRRVAPPHRPA